MNLEDALTANNFQRSMIDYIRAHYGALLGPHAALLDEPDGLDRLAELLREGKLGC